MATIKSYADIEQSKKLAEILPLESADMHYNNASIKGINYVDEYRAELMDYNTAQKVLSKYLINPMFEIIPCWSLAALRNLLPVGIKVNENTYLFESHNTFDKSWVYRYYNEDDTSYLYYNYTSEIDACVAMIEKLHELKML